LLAQLLRPSFSFGAPKEQRSKKKSAFWANRSAGPEAGSTLLGRALLGCMALDFRPLHSIYWDYCFGLLSLLIERYRAYPGRKVRRHHGLICSY
jgi:hypothetical protein